MRTANAMQAFGRAWHVLAHVLCGLAVVPLAACGDEGIWGDSSVAIDFTLWSLGTKVCTFSATRAELTQDQLDGLYALRLHDAEALAGCDGLRYRVTVHSAYGSSESSSATSIECSSKPILLFGDFDAWAQTTPCSSESASSSRSDLRSFPERSKTAY